LDWKDAPCFFRYWGKAKPSGDQNGENPCHLLPFHSLDVAAVGYHLLAPHTARCQELASAMSLEPEQLRSLFVFSLALHDLGKFARAFQSLADPDLPDLVKPDASLAYGTAEWPHHSEAGAVFLKAFLKDELKREGLQAWGWSESGSDAKSFLRVLLGMAFGHHGKPVDAGNNRTPSPGFPEDHQAAWEYTCEVASWLRPQWPEQLVQDRNWLKQFRRLTWHLAGFAVLADWLGSDQSVFPYQATPQALGDYWQGRALPRAELALAALGFGAPLAPSSFPGVRRFFGFEPTPLQQWAQDLPWRPGPQLFVLEDVTGAGKTEAAMTLVHRLLEHGQARGVYFGLPTMATSNAMYGRVADIYRRWFDEQQVPNLVLAHGARHLNTDFAHSVVSEQARDHAYGDGEQTASAACNQWFADSRKKALLADVGVGTVDQALMAVLPFKHQTLRLIGLANKVLVVDEVHACDDYMAGLLEAVLQAHAQQGGSAILLTATLPHSMKRNLVAAYQKGRGLAAEVVEEQPSFPLATRVTDQSLEQTPLATRDSVIRRVAVEMFNKPEAVIEHLLDTAESGQCGCWIRNTVDDAISAYQVLRERAPDPDKVVLFHSRFVMADRQAIEQAALERFGKTSTAETRAGWILISTQVVEQSLDLDFDQMISDLAPMDLLIQRAGRLHRHRRDGSGNPVDTDDQRPSPVLYLFTPPYEDRPASDWLSAHLPGTGAVYRDHGQLWLTLRTLLDEGGIDMPGRARHLIESVFGEDAESWIPEGLQQRHLDQEGERSSRRAMAGFNRLKMDQGYSTQASHGWMDDLHLDIGTRLNEEPSITVTLVRQDEDGALKPWVDAGPFSWERSQLQARESLARRLPEWPQPLAAQRDALVERCPSLKFSQLWLAEEESSMNYSQEIGLHRAWYGREG
jgi:CRISPR-associated endonuclease/helicase Cas3|tara:strand:- start:46060 stop:48795 length:2736 start_codon:yes stop_codon:yes gene_type:complete